MQTSGWCEAQDGRLQCATGYLPRGGGEIAWEGLARNRDRTPHWLPRTNYIVSTYAAIHRGDSVRAGRVRRSPILRPLKRVGAASTASTSSASGLLGSTCFECVPAAYAVAFTKWPSGSIGHISPAIRRVPGPIVRPLDSSWRFSRASICDSPLSCSRMRAC